MKEGEKTTKRKKKHWDLTIGEITGSQWDDNQSQLKGWGQNSNRFVHAKRQEMEKREEEWGKKKFN